MRRVTVVIGVWVVLAGLLVPTALADGEASFDLSIEGCLELDSGSPATIDLAITNLTGQPLDLTVMFQNRSEASEADGEDFPWYSLQPISLAVGETASARWDVLPETLGPGDYRNWIVAAWVGTPFVGANYRFGEGYAYVPPCPDVVRYAGPSRFATAAAISAGDFPDPSAVDTVFIATGNNYPDALAGAAVAGKLGAPLLLVQTPNTTYRGVNIGSGLPSETLDELNRLTPDTIVLLGGTAVVATELEPQLAALAFAPTVIRLAGPDRYATAVTISQYGFSGESSEVVISTGTGFADALAGGPAAVALDAPVLLTDPNGLPGVVATEITRLNPSRIVVVGGTAAVSEAVVDQLKVLQPNTVRLAGVNRYETAVQISQDAFSGGSTRVYVATGLNFPDALAGAAAAGWWNSPMLLIPGTSLPAAVVAEIVRLGATDVVVLGGTGVVTPAVETSLGTLQPM